MQSTQQLHQALTTPSAALPTAHPLLAEAISMLPYLASTAGVRVCLYEPHGLFLAADNKPYIRCIQLWINLSNSPSRFKSSSVSELFSVGSASCRRCCNLHKKHFKCFKLYRHQPVQNMNSSTAEVRISQLCLSWRKCANKILHSSIK
jgi:hypothetical protein